MQTETAKGSKGKRAKGPPKKGSKRFEEAMRASHAKDVDEAFPPKDVEELVTKKLSAPELAELGEMLAKTQADIEEIEVDQKQANADFKAKLDPLKSERSELAKKINAEESEEKIAAVETYNFKNNTAEIRRKDNGKLIRTRPLTAAERQASLFPGESGGKKAASGPGEVLDEALDVE